jgi:hypothetical protein
MNHPDRDTDLSNNFMLRSSIPSTRINLLNVVVRQGQFTFLSEGSTRDDSHSYGIKVKISP